ncbi:Pimeloyl-ACP methyl ester carboxylesterase [Pedobacter westerhofensis]|uniref:Pimeloyl-ACP methyl ester carboxylesterase n=1 Tax=Pedobacter westerhofensis TaxID=425512 RepID=A0A521CSW6_9SPHI|nr:alpha/beta hydrolase [Pedobacter westerhofensis]SMO62475.1 Pimeloyl-ACP methyl ester carboxylesterase [Pedobacter westerhofensis]
MKNLKFIRHSSIAFTAAFALSASLSLSTHAQVAKPSATTSAQPAKPAAPAAVQQTKPAAKPAPVVAAQPAKVVKNIVLVHGAFVDGSGWKPVYDILYKKGYHVTVTQQPLNSFENDVAAVKRVLDLQDGPCILVGHSYGGAVITVAGNDPHVAGLVYIAAHAPDKGETEAGNGKLYPSAYKSLQKGADGFDYIKPEMFYADFAADLPKYRATFMADAQMPTADVVFRAVIQTPAWRSRPSWYMVAQSDRIINPDLERFYAKRATSKTVEIAGASHAVFESHPVEVANLIIDAATHIK